METNIVLNNIIDKLKLIIYNNFKKDINLQYNGLTIYVIEVIFINNVIYMRYKYKLNNNEYELVDKIYINYEMEQYKKILLAKINNLKKDNIKISLDISPEDNNILIYYLYYYHKEKINDIINYLNDKYNIESKNYLSKNL